MHRRRHEAACALLGESRVVSPTSCCLCLTSKPRDCQVSDDMRPQLNVAYGSKFMHTPNLDRLAASGTVFDRHYTNFAICSASRNSFMTGRMPDTTQVIGYGRLPVRAALGQWGLSCDVDRCWGVPQPLNLPGLNFAGCDLGRCGTLFSTSECPNTGTTQQTSPCPATLSRWVSFPLWCLNTSRLLRSRRSQGHNGTIRRPGT